MKFRTLVSAGMIVAAVAPSSALALDSTPQVIAGTTQSSLSISIPTPATFVGGFTPGQTSNSTGGTVTALSTSPNWSLSVKDSTADANGRMNKLAAGDTTALTSLVGAANLPSLGNPTDCASSESELTHPVQVSATPTVALTSGNPLFGNITLPAAQSLTGAGVTIASAKAGSLVPLAATSFNTNFSQQVDPSETLQSLCTYHIETTYTVG